MLSLCLLLLPLTEAGPPSLTLADAVARATSRDPGVGRAGAEGERARLAALRARLDRVHLSVDASLEELWAGSSAGASAGLGLSNAAASLVVPLFEGFGGAAHLDGADAEVRAARAALEEERRRVGLAVAQAYWAVRKLDLLAEVEAEALARMARAESVARARVAAGLAPPIDERRATARRMAQEALLEGLRGHRAEAEAPLAAALGVEPPLVLADAPLAPARTGSTAVGGAAARVAEARGARPALAGASARVEAAQHAVTVARAAYYPQLSAYGRLQVGNNPALAGAGSRAVPASADPFAGMAADVQVGAVLSVNLFDTLRTAHAVEDAERRVEIAQADRRAADQRVEAEVRAALAKSGRCDAQLARLGPLREVTDDNVRLLERRYESGEAQIFELLDAELARLDVARQAVEARAERTLAALELEAAIGGGPLGPRGAGR